MEIELQVKEHQGMVWGITQIDGTLISENTFSIPDLKTRILASARDTNLFKGGAIRQKKVKLIVKYEKR